MASGNTINHTTALGMLANAVPYPGSGGSLSVNDQDSLVCVLDPAGTETIYLEDGTIPGQRLFLINPTANTVTVTDKASSANTVATVATLETAMCVYTGLDADPWNAVVLKQGAT